jgi:hypothetical protein
MSVKKRYQLQEKVEGKMEEVFSSGVSCKFFAPSEGCSADASL